MIRVVIFEDNDVLRQSLASYLSLDDAIEVVGQFADVMKISEQLRILCPDVVLMDIDMPGRNGIEGVAAIRKISQGIQVMMLTVFENDENIFNALRAGANGYLLKKTPPAQIVDAVKELHAGGAPMSGTIARKVLNNFHASGTGSEKPETLTQRETEILQMLVRGNSYKMIAAFFKISPHTVRNHIHNIYEKLHVSSATEAAYKAFRR